METKLEKVLPRDIEGRSMAIIEKEINEMDQEMIDLWNGKTEEEKKIIKRCIHTSADFDYLKNLLFSDGAVMKMIDALKKGCTIVTDTNMAKAGISKEAADKLGCKVVSFMSDDDVAEAAMKQGTTRAVCCMDKACKLDGPVLIAVGNAPTALVKIHELVDSGKLKPEGVIAIPVGFVNVVPAKEIMVLDGKDGKFPTIVGRGRKGGSNVAAAIVNAMLYIATGRI